MFTFMLAGESGKSATQTRRRVIVGVDASVEAEAAAKWAVREAELRQADVLLVHAYEVPLLPAHNRLATIARGRQEREALLDKVAATLVVPAAMHLDRLIEIDTPEYLLPSLSELAELTVLGQDHPALTGRMPLGHTASSVASMSRHPVVAVPRGWITRVDDQRPIAVAIDGRHPSRTTLGYPSPRQACGRSRSLWCTRRRWLSWSMVIRTPGSMWRRFWRAGRLTIPTLR